MAAINTLLIANRGEIARRIIRTARELGLTTVAVYSDIDADAPHVREADRAVRLGPAPARDSYLDIDKVIRAARDSGADAIHPGYGFLSENTAFADACADAGLIFVGPGADAIRLMGDKAAARQHMAQSGVPVLPGFDREGADDATLIAEAQKVGFPLLIKAVAGGGGKGMRAVDNAAGFEEALAAARREARNAFGDDRVLLERYLPTARHVEVQVFADNHGNAVHLFERDCSAQRRHQKVLEEAPAPGMTDETRAAMGAAAVAAAKAVNYAGAGTIEFIADGSGTLRPDGFWFMEMNTRLQVEHPVTEMITGQDLVEWQFRVASGEDLPLSQDEISIRGHAVEVRLYAEDPDTGFLPSTGRLDLLELPESEGVRIDTGVETGAEISAFYDPMIAKLIAYGPDRQTALDRLAAQFGRSLIAGPKNNLAFLAALVAHEDVRRGGFDTGLIDRDLARLTAGEVGEETIAAAVAALVLPEAAAAETSGWQDPFAATNAFELTGRRQTGVRVEVDGEPREVAIEWHVVDLCPH